MCTGTLFIAIQFIHHAQIIRIASFGVLFTWWSWRLTTSDVLIWKIAEKYLHHLDDNALMNYSTELPLEAEGQQGLVQKM